jgi:glycosyltransferase involved in cell wall biosynthesis
VKVIFLFAYECFPYNRTGSTIGAQRPYYMAKSLVALGWRPVVFCCSTDNRIGVKKKELLNYVSHLLSDIEKYNRDGVYMLPIPALRGSNLLVDLWYKCIHIRDNGTFKYRSSIGAFLGGIISFINLLRFNDYSCNWHKAALIAAEALKIRFPPSFIIGEHSPNAGLYAARLFANKYQIKWMCDFRDPAIQFAPTFLHNYVNYKIRHLLASASFTSNVNPYWSELDKKSYRLPSITVTNGFVEEEYKGSGIDIEDTRFKLVYYGKIGSQQNIEPLFSAMAILKERIPSGAFCLYYFGFAHKKIHGFVDSFKLHQYVEIQSFVDRISMMSTLKKFQMGIVLSTDPSMDSAAIFKKGFYPGKLFEFLGASIPVLCIPGDKAQMANFLIETEMGVSLGLPEDIANYLEEAIRNWQRGTYKKEINHEKRAKYTRFNQFKILEQNIRNTLT